MRRWNELNDLLLKYEDVLRKRWLKKTVPKRKQILLEAWPNLPAYHRPDIDAFINETHEDRIAGTSFRYAFLLPYLNLEDLVKPKNLLLFLHSRGHNPPHVFASFDLKTQQLGRRCSAIQAGLIEGYVMLTSSGEYGDIIPLNSDSAIDRLYRGITPQPGDGLLLLEIHNYVLLFLLRCAKIILHDAPTPQSLPSSALDMYDEEWPSVVDRIIETPYRMPVQCNISRMRSLVDGKVEEAEDHIWALREDPEYFRECVHDYSEHNPTSIVDTKGKRCTDTESWRRILWHLVSEAYGNLLWWLWMQEELSQAEALRPNVAMSDTLPAEYEQRLRRITWVVKELREAYTQMFTNEYFRRCPCASSLSVDSRIPVLLPLFAKRMSSFLLITDHK